MNTDRLLRIHQSVNLAVIREQNKYMLGYQAEQCGQIMKLREQIEASNSMTRQILENQLKEIQHQEYLKYYKALVYNIREAVNVIAEIEDMVFKFFLNHLFYDVFRLYLQEAKENLEEISDKVFCSEIENVLKANVEQTLAMKDEYLRSTFHTLLDSEDDYGKLQSQLLEEKKKLISLEKEYEENRTASPKSYNRFFPGLVICGISLLLFAWMKVFVLCLPIFAIYILLICKEKKWKKNYTSYLDDFKRKQELLEVNAPFIIAKKEYNDLEIQLKEHPYIRAKYDLSLKYPMWEEILKKISSYLPAPQKTKEIKTENVDPLLYEVAKWIVVKQNRVTVASIQRKYSIGYNRGSRIVNQLEELGIINKGTVQFSNVDMLDSFWVNMEL